MWVSKLNAVTLSLILPIHTFVEASLTVWAPHIPNFDYRSLLDPSAAVPSTPQLDDLTGGPFAIKVLARFDDASIANQRIFEFGTARNSDVHDTISFGQNGTGMAVRFLVNNAATNTTRTLVVENAIDEGILTTWVVGVNESMRMFIQKNGVEIGSRSDGLWPQDDVPRTYKEISRSIWDGEGQLQGAVLGLQFLQGSQSHSHYPLEFWNFPGQILQEGGFSVSGYAMFNNVTGGKWQRVFDFGNSPFFEIVNLGQFDGSNTMRLEVHNDGYFGQALDAPNAIVEGEFAFWEAGISSNGIAFIRKDGQLIAYTQGFLTPKRQMRHNNFIGSSNWANDLPLNGVVLGLRLDMQGDIV